jgi:quinoprotein glucose dehydrogenase
MLSGVLLWLGRSLGSLVYAGMLLGTIVWSLWEVGFDMWALLPRLLAPLVIGVWLLTPWLKRGLEDRDLMPGTFFARHPTAAGALVLG